LRCRKENVPLVMLRPNTSVADEIAHCAVSISEGLRHAAGPDFKSPAPAIWCDTGVSFIADRLQADRFGDHDHAKSSLDRTVAKETGPSNVARLASFDQKRTELTLGTGLVRDGIRRSQRVMVRLTF